MADTSNRTYTLDAERLGRTIEVLKRAAEAFGLTRRERITYRVLLISGDVAAVSYASVLLLTTWTVALSSTTPTGFIETLIIVGWSLLVVSMIAQTLAILLNVPVFLKTWREWAELRKIGLASLSTSLWKVGRRHPWLQWIRGVFLLFAGAAFALLAVSLGHALFTTERSGGVVAGTTFVTLIVLTMMGARYLRNLREEIDLVANAERLQEALRELRRHAGDGAAISIPAETLEQVARIESAQIAQERRTAVLESAGSSPAGYAVSFAREAAEQRSALDVTGRIELEDLVEQLSTRTSQIEPVAHNAEGVKRARTASAVVEIEYDTDEPRCEMRVTAVRRIADGADRNPVREGYGHG